MTKTFQDRSPDETRPQQEKCGVYSSLTDVTGMYINHCSVVIPHTSYIYSQRYSAQFKTRRAHPETSLNLHNGMALKDALSEISEDLTEIFK